MKHILTIRTRHTLQEAFSGYLYILPSFLMILVFSVLPIFMSVFYCFTKFNVIQSPKFVGIANFTRMLSDPFIGASVSNTIVYTVITVPLQTIFALILANVFASIKESFWKNFIKSSTFVPVISSMIIGGVLWRTMFNADNGVINSISGLFGIPAVNWLGGSFTAMISICIVTIWKLVGYFLVIYYAAIMNIPKSYYEAANTDGANILQKFLYITIPCLRNITFLVVTLGTIWSFQVFDLVYAMTGGGPGISTVTLVMTIYNTAFREYNMGYASAISFLLFAIIVVVSVVQKRFLGERSEKY